MEENVFNRKKFITSFTVMFLVLSVLSMGIMLYYASTKVIIVSAKEADEQARESTETRSGTPGSKSFTLEFKSTTKDGYFVVPCPSDAEFVSEVRPDKKTIVLSFDGINQNFFVGNAPYGDFTGVKGISEQLDDKNATVVIECEKPSYGNISRNGREVLVRLSDVDKEETVVVIDPSYGGAYTGTTVGGLMEKDINLAIALKVRKLCVNKPYRIALTRDCDIWIPTDERLDIIDAYGADYYVGIALNTNMDDQADFGISGCYNAEYFRNGFENVDFADCILRAVCNETSNLAKELADAGEDNVILRVLKIPGTELHAGTITNTDEAALLQSEEYIERIAAGIIKGLDGVVE